MKTRAEPLTVIILAGGRSLRLGRNKALLDVGGLPLLAALVAQARRLSERILISAADSRAFRFLGLPLVVDERPGLGPLAAILSGLRASATALNLILACDIPEIRLPFLKKMIARSARADIVVPRYRDGKTEPLLALYRRGLIPLIEEQLAGGDCRIASLFGRCRTAYVAADGQKTWLQNINTLDDYRRYLRRCRSACLPKCQR